MFVDATFKGSGDHEVYRKGRFIGRTILQGGGFVKISALKVSLCVASCSVAIQASESLGAVVALAPVADTYVASSSPGTVRGAEKVLTVNQSANTNHRWAYVRFDLSGIDFSTVTNLKFDLHTSITGTVTNVDVYGLTSNDAFTESALTYNNDPNRTLPGGNTFNTGSAYGGQPLATFQSQVAAGPVGTLETAFDVSSGPVFDFIGADSDKIVTFVLNQQTTTGQGGQQWSSKEATDTSMQPLLTVTTSSETPEPAALAVVSLVAVGAMKRRRHQA
ncbi:MAG: DNRLRE domain-containing protein [Tepidisphaeraceae bacterium]